MILSLEAGARTKEAAEARIGGEGEAEEALAVGSTAQLARERIQSFGLDLSDDSDVDISGDNGLSLSDRRCRRPFLSTCACATLSSPSSRRPCRLPRF